MGGSGIDCCGTAPELLLLADLTLARYAVKAPLVRPWDPLVEDAFSALSVSDLTDWTTEGAALEWRDHLRTGCASWLDCPVLDERFSNEGCCMLLLSPEAVCEDMASSRGVRASVITGLTVRVITRTKRYG